MPTSVGFADLPHIQHSRRRSACPHRPKSPPVSYVATVAKHAGGDNATITLQPAYANGANAAWATATPSGKIELNVTNPDAIAFFEQALIDGMKGNLGLTFERVPVE